MKLVLASVRCEMMGRMMEDPQAHQEMIEMMSGMEGMEGMEGMPRDSAR